VDWGGEAFWGKKKKEAPRREGGKKKKKGGRVSLKEWIRSGREEMGRGKRGLSKL